MARKKRPAAKKPAKKPAKKAKSSRAKKTPRGTSAGVADLEAVSQVGEPGSKGDLVSQPAPEVPPASSSTANTVNLSLEVIDALRAISEQMAQGQASTNRILLDFHGRLTRLEEGLQQEVEDKSVPAETQKLRAETARICKYIKMRGPTPALIGRAMHDALAFSKNHAVRIVPREVFQSMRPDRLSPEIKEILAQIPSCESSVIAQKLGRQFDRRFKVIMDLGLGGKEPIGHGKRPDYRRFLDEWGAKVFRKWPDWDDDSEGTSLAGPPKPLASAPEEAPGVGGGPSSLPSAGDVPPATPDGSPSSPPVT